MIQLEDTLAQVRKEYEMLRIEFEQTLAANEQAGMELFYVKKNIKLEGCIAAQHFNIIPFLLLNTCSVRFQKQSSSHDSGQASSMLSDFLVGVAKYWILLIIWFMTEHFALLKNYFWED